MSEHTPSGRHELNVDQLVSLTNKQFEELEQQAGRVWAIHEARRAVDALMHYGDELRGQAPTSEMLADEFVKIQQRLANVRAFIAERSEDPILLSIEDLRRLVDSEDAVRARRQAKIILDTLQSVPHEIDLATTEAGKFMPEDWQASKADIEDYIAQVKAFIVEVDTRLSYDQKD